MTLTFRSTKAARSTGGSCTRPGTPTRPRKSEQTMSCSTACSSARSSISGCCGPGSTARRTTQPAFLGSPRSSGETVRITAIEMVAWLPGDGLEQTLRVLANRLGRSAASCSRGEPGKVIHELRLGDGSAGRLTAHPLLRHGRRHPLLLRLLAEHAQWSGSLALFHPSCARGGRAHPPLDRRLRRPRRRRSCSTTTPRQPQPAFATRAGATPTTASWTSTERHWSHRSR